MKNKKGVSPLIATVILVGIAIVIFGIVFFWLRNLVSEQVQKFDDPIETQCQKVIFSAKAEGDNIYLNNQGNLPIVGLNVKIKTAAGKTMSEPTMTSLDGVISAGETDVINASYGGFDFAHAQKRTIAPLIQGMTVNSKKPQRFLCSDN